MSSYEEKIEKEPVQESADSGTADGDETESVPDPQEVLREECRRKCGKHVVKYDGCNERVTSKTQTREICFEELIDLLHCVEHCVAEDLFKMLK